MEKRDDDDLLPKVVFGIIAGVIAIIIGSSALLDGVNKDAIDPPSAIMTGQIALFVGSILIIASIIAFFRWLKNK